jgi:hypothetical protein
VPWLIAAAYIPSGPGHSFQPGHFCTLLICKIAHQRGPTAAMPPKSQKIAAAGRLIGYARVSTDEQGTDPQRDELGAAGCSTILEEHASCADRSRPVSRVRDRKNPVPGAGLGRDVCPGSR